MLLHNLLPLYLCSPSLYHWIYDVDGKEVEKCQFINVFRKQEKSVKYKVLCQQNFTEIILSYDLSDLDLL